MPAGFTATMTKATIDAACGNVASVLNRAFRDVEAAKHFLDVQQDADLVALGYTSGDVATLKSALADLDQLRVIYEGGAALAAPKDFRAFAQRIWGTGFVLGQ